MSLRPTMVLRCTMVVKAKRQRSRCIQGAGTIAQLPSGRWRLRVTFEGRQVTYGTYLTEDSAADAQALWRLTGLLPRDDFKRIVGSGIARPANS